MLLYFLSSRLFYSIIFTQFALTLTIIHETGHHSLMVPVAGRCLKDARRRQGLDHATMFLAEVSRDVFVVIHNLFCLRLVCYDQNKEAGKKNSIGVGREKEEKQAREVGASMGVWGGHVSLENLSLLPTGGTAVP